MARRTRKNVGIIGLGIIGTRVADNLRRKGFPVFVWNRTPRPVPNFVGSPMELAELCDLIQIFVSDDDALLEMVQRMKSTLTKQHIVIANCTVSPDTVRAAAEIIDRRGGRLLDAPFTGSKEAAANGELVYYVGGESSAIAEARPLLEASGKEVVEIGVVGQASAMKIATNIITAATVQAAAEALALVVDAAIEPEKFITAMRSNGSNSRTLEMKLPKMISGDLAPHFSVKHMLKDMAIASRSARAIGLDFGAADAARHALIAQERAGRAEADYCAVIRNFFPDDVPLGQEAAPAAAREDQPALTGLESRGAGELFGVARLETGAPAEQTPTPAIHADIAQPAPVVAEAAEPMASSALAQPESSFANGETPAEVPAAAAVESDVSSTAGSLFRRFVRRGSSD